MKTRKELTEKVSKLIADMCLRWKKHFNSAAPIEFIDSTSLLIISEVIMYQLEKTSIEKEDDNDTDN